MLSETGTPTPVAWTRLYAPQSLMAAADNAVLTGIVTNSPLYPKYANAIDRESAYELLAARHTVPQPPETAASAPKAAKAPEENLAEKILGSPVAKSMLRAGATAAAGAIVRGIFSTSRKR